MLDSPQKRLAAQSFSYFVSNFWKTRYFFRPKNILKAIGMIVGNSYRRFSRKKIETSSVLVSCSHVACKFTNRGLLLEHFETFRMGSFGGTPLGGYYLCNKACKEQSDHYLLTRKNARAYYYLCKHFTVSLP